MSESETSSRKKFLDKTHDYIERSGKDFERATSINLNDAENYKKIGVGMEKDLGDRFESYRNLGHDIKYLKKIIGEYVPDDHKKDIYKAVGYVNSDVDKLKKVLRDYRNATEKMSKLSYEKGKVSNDPIDAHMKRTRLKKIEDEMNSYTIELNNFNSVIRDYFERIHATVKSTNEKIISYKKARSPEKESAIGNAVLVVFSAVFGMSVLWALAQTQTESVTVGAFVAGGEASPILISMLTGTVIFLAFFLSHHKLK